MPTDYSAYLLAVVFILGAATGSFLNICIYRLPRDLSDGTLRWFFCRSCHAPISFWRQLPFVSWARITGHCTHCGKRVSRRDGFVELLTGLLFVAIWLRVGPQHWLLAVPLWVFVGLLVVATFIDFEYFIIPNEITWGGVAGGVLFSLAIPRLMGTDRFWLAGLWSLAGAALGYLLLWSVVEVGKKALGKKRVVFDRPEAFVWRNPNEKTAELEIEGEKLRWGDVFARDSDRLLLQCASVELEESHFEQVTLEFHYDRLRIGEREWDLNQFTGIGGVATEMTIPREVMGFGDVKFIAAIGAFLGWKAVLFTIVAAASVGAVVGLTAIALGKREVSAEIPFGPYLALGALLWMFWGPQLFEWYRSLFVSLL